MVESGCDNIKPAQLLKETEMLRKIEFRGKRVDNGEWIYGDLLQWVKKNKAAITPQNGDEWSNPYDFEVDPTTIGQFTGLHDKNGVKIWEGDLVNHFGDTMVIVYRHGAFFHKHLTYEAYGSIYNAPYKNDNVAKHYEVIGNLHAK